MQTSDTSPKKSVFVLMPFSEKFEDIYKLGIRPACESAGAYCERIDEQIFQESILDRIYNQISKADLIVADMTGRNPNVFYETGYAHALNKRVILLTQTADDIPFDLKHYTHIVYSGRIAFLKEKLEHNFQWYLNQPDHTTVDVSSLLQYYTKEGVKIQDQMELVLSAKRYRALIEISCFFTFAVHNPTSRLLTHRVCTII